MSEWSDGTNSPTSTEFQYWSYEYFFIKNNYSWISHAKLTIWWWRSNKVSSRSVFVFACHVIIRNNSYSWIFLCYFSNNFDDLLTISVTFTWFYKPENIVMWQIKIDFGSHHTSWNISLAILKVLLFLKACLNSYEVI